MTMTPTRAQIDAALKAYNASTKSSYPENAMRAAIIAANGVAQRTANMAIDKLRRLGYPEEADEILTTAAGVDTSIDQQVTIATNVEAETIERCAQAALDYMGKRKSFRPTGVAAAIRALKDEP